MLPGKASHCKMMMAATKMEIVLAVAVVLNLVGLSIAAYRIMKRK
jgi:hypothetical protein